MSVFVCSLCNYSKEDCSYVYYGGKIYLRDGRTGKPNFKMPIKKADYYCQDCERVLCFHCSDAGNIFSSICRNCDSKNVISIPNISKIDRYMINNYSIGGGDESWDCYIATSCYGQNTKQVNRLRKFRDKTLKSSILGKCFISLYYYFSPFVAKKLSQHLFINNLVRKYILDKILIIIDKFNL